MSGKGRQARARGWFSEHRKLVWISTAAAAVVGRGQPCVRVLRDRHLDPRLVLPAHANVAVGWLIKLGLALWIATLVHCEPRLARARSDSVFPAPIAEAAMTSVSALSQASTCFARSRTFSCLSIDRR